eukprot:12196314-Alexandrium_andersonii.AAC.1
MAAQAHAYAEHVRKSERSRAAAATRRRLTGPGAVLTTHRMLKNPLEGGLLLQTREDGTIVADPLVVDEIDRK